MANRLRPVWPLRAAGAAQGSTPISQLLRSPAPFRHQMSSLITTLSAQPIETIKQPRRLGGRIAAGAEGNRGALTSEVLPLGGRFEAAFGHAALWAVAQTLRPIESSLAVALKLALRRGSPRPGLKGLRPAVTATRGTALPSDTIIGVPLEPSNLTSLLQGEAQSEDIQAGETCRRLFKIRSADSEGRRSSASILINRMYASRGYHSAGLPAEQLPTRITLVASEYEEPIGTISIGFDSAAGLQVDDPFAEETRVLRSSGRKICEFTTLAMDSVVRSKRVLASLFHVAYIYAHRMMGFDSLLIEVNPRHVRYYVRMLGFRVVGAQRLNRRVNAPAVLMCLDFSHAHEQIARFGGTQVVAEQERSLYPYFFSVAEEASIVGRLKRTQPDAAYSHTQSDPPPGPYRAAA